MKCMPGIHFLVVCLLVGSVVSHANAQSLTVTVQADRVNLRAQSNLTSEVVAQANWGDLLQAKSVHAEWVEVLPPTNVAFWVHGSFLHNETIVKPRKLNVRAGPGTNYSIVGRLERNEEVVIVEEFQEWRRIAAPEETSLWIARDYVQIPRRSPLTPPAAVQPASTPRTVVPTPTATPRPLPTPTPVMIESVKVVEVEVFVPQVLPEPTPTVAPPRDLDLIPLPGQGGVSTRKGLVKAYLLAGTRPSRFQLVRVDESGRLHTLCYLEGTDEQLKSFVGKQVKMSGRDYWVTGQSLPVMVPRSIELAEE